MPTHFNRPVRRLAASVVAVLSLVSIVPLILTARLAALAAQSDLSRFPPQVKFNGDGDHQHMMDQLGIKALRPGANPNDQSTFDEASANKYPLPELMVMKNCTKVTKSKQWPARRAEIQEDFEREVYGCIPGTPGNYLTDPMPSVGQLIGGELAWGQHSGGHSVAENWPAFIEWASQLIKGPGGLVDTSSGSKPRQQKFTPNKASGLNTTVEKHGQLNAGAAPAADQPAPRSDQNSQIAHLQLLEKARMGRIDIYFEGDSITRRWGTSDEQYKAFLANWQQNFFGWNAADFGWGGDTTQNILWRLKNGELDNVNPKIIVIMAGTNNVGKLSAESSEDARVAEVTRGIKAILYVCRQKAPNATIVLMGITPRNDNLAMMPIINQINDNIARFADGKKTKYLNINDRLADKDGKLFKGMANRDGLHLDVKGYQVWADALKPIFTELLGPPAKEDHAPPPTGDPSTRKISANSRQSKGRK